MAKKAETPAMAPVVGEAPALQDGAGSAQLGVAAPDMPPAPSTATAPIVATAVATARSADVPDMVAIDVLSPIEDGVRHEVGERIIVTSAAARDLVAAGAAAYAAD